MKLMNGQRRRPCGLWVLCQDLCVLPVEWPRGAGTCDPISGSWSSDSLDNSIESAQLVRGWCHWDPWRPGFVTTFSPAPHIPIRGPPLIRFPVLTMWRKPRRVQLHECFHWTQPTPKRYLLVKLALNETKSVVILCKSLPNHLIIQLFNFCIGMTLISTIQYVSSVRFDSNSCVYCLVCSPPVVRFPSVTAKMISWTP